MTFHRVFILRDEKVAAHLHAFLKANAKAMAASGKPIQVTLTEEQTQRSVQQNKRYWAVLQTIEDMGWASGKQFTREAWHHYFRVKFLPCLDGPDGLVIPTSTTKLSVEEMNTYMSQVEAWAGENLGIDFLEVA